MKTYYSTFALVVFWIATNAQKVHILQTDIGAVVSTSKQVPFWQQSNVFGAAPHAAPALTGRIRLFSQAFSKIDSSGKRHFFDWNYGLDLVGNAAAQSNVALIEAYLGFRVGSFKIEAGRKSEVIGILDTLLTTGAMSYSGNALPIPKVQLSTNGFVDVPFTKRLLAFQGTIAHGWLGEQRISPNYFPITNGVINNYGHYLNTYFHQKTFYGRLGKPSWKINFYGGFNHQAFWGNEQAIWTWSDLDFAKAYRYVLLGLVWEYSKVGNHFGTIDLAFKVNGKKWDMLLYRQSIYDTGSLLNALNLDALNGVSFQNKEKKKDEELSIKKIVVEYIYTNDQVEPRNPVGRNDYFNHYIYLDGWTYQKRLLGTPFGTIDRNLKENIDTPDFAGGYISNNRIIALHLGVNGSYRHLDFTSKFSYSHNKGTYAVPFTQPRNQLSSFLSLSKPMSFWGGSVGKLSIAADVGALYPAQVAIQASLLKTWRF